MNVKIYCILLGLFLINACSIEDNSSSSEMTKSGSYATMLTISNNLYIVNKTQITTFDVTDPKNPVEVNKQEVGFDIESLYHHKGLLLIGSANNMYIYRIGSKGIPVRESNTTYSQTFGNEVCTSDPIVVKDTIAYVTLASTQQVCRGFVNINQLRLYNIKNINAPNLLLTINMSAPKGLGFGKNHLFICDAKDGLVIFNLDNPLKPVKVKTFNGFEGYDLIVNDKILVVVAKNQLLQYDISDETNIKYLSKIDL
ncbi:MAG: hypothetical protein IPO37_14455 [Saprospiraceae bacterium]|jgi:hypothetical protein|nr:hypothetical protein [Saprospiraceae bacterium]